MPSATSQALAEAAAEYARRGWGVFPCYSVRTTGSCSCGSPSCGSPGKHPRTEHGFRDASRDPEQVRAWWERWPRANIGVATGAASGIVVLDVDDRAGGRDSLVDLEQANGKLPTTVEQKTGGGGRHLFFEAPTDGPTKNAVGLAPGLDFRGDGGYVLVPPSNHRSGNLYSWDVLGDPAELLPAPLPAWLLALVRDRPDAPNGQYRPPLKTAAILAGVPKGERDMTLFRLASKLRAADVPIDMARTLILEAAGLCYDPATGELDPFPETLALEKVERAYQRYVPDETIEYRPGHGKRKPGSDGKGAGRERPKVEILDADTIYSGPILEPNWVVPGVLAEGLGILGGKPKMGKSWLELELALSVATGQPFLNKFPVTAGRVLYVALEDNRRRMQERLHILTDDRKPQHLDRLHCIFRMPTFDAGGLDEIALFADQYADLKLVVIDTLARARPPRVRGASVYDEDYQVLAAVQELALPRGLCIQIVHHMRKAFSDDPYETFNGSFGITGAADSLWALMRERGQADAVLWVGGRDVTDQKLGLRWELSTCRFSYLGDADELKTSQERAAILGVLRASDQWLQPKDIAGILNKPRHGIQYLLARLVVDGLVLASSGRYSVARRQAADR